MGLLNENYQDKRLNKKVKPAIQGGGYNYLGKEETVTVPKRWLSDPDHVVAELAYITPREQKILLDANLYGSLKGKPNKGPGGLPSLQGDMGSVGGGGSTGGGDGGDTREQYGAVGQYSGTTSSPTSTGDNDKPNIGEITGPAPTVDMSHYGDPDPEVDKPTSQRDDTITSAKDNIVADFKSNPWGYTGLLGITFNSLNQLYKTNKARAMMGLDPIGGTADDSADNGDEGQGEGNSSNDLLNILAPTAPYLVGGTDAVPSEASKWYNSIGNNTKQFNFAESYATAKIKIGQTLNNKGPIGMLAVSQSPYYDWLKTNKLNKGIL